MTTALEPGKAVEARLHRHRWKQIHGGLCTVQWRLA